MRALHREGFPPSSQSIPIYIDTRGPNQETALGEEASLLTCFCFIAPSVPAWAFFRPSDA